MPILIDNNGITDPAVNLALEEYCISDLPPDLDCLLLTVNAPAVVIGKHQCVFAEANLMAAHRAGIRILRRISGGGAVYHDSGNLNFSFISAFDRARFGNYAVFLRPVMDILQALGVPVAQAGKSDLRVDGLKVSGNAQYANTRRMLCHGTLLFDARIDRLREVLTPSETVLEARGVPSVRSEVARIRDYLSEDMDMPDFIRSVRDGLSQRLPVSGYRRLAPAEWHRIHQMAEAKYRRWEWNIARSPWCRIRCRLPNGGMEGPEAEVDVDRGLITKIVMANGAGKTGHWKGRRFEDLLVALENARQGND